MSKPRIQIDTDVREMTDAEHAQYVADVDQAEERRYATEALSEARMSARVKLLTLGLTEDEIVALIGA